MAVLSYIIEHQKQGYKKKYRLVHEEKAINQTWLCVAHLWCKVYGQSGRVFGRRLPPSDLT